MEVQASQESTSPWMWDVETIPLQPMTYVWVVVPSVVQAASVLFVEKLEKQG